MVPHDFISKKLKKLQEAESLPFCLTVDDFFLQHDSEGVTSHIYDKVTLKIAFCLQLLNVYLLNNDS